MCGIVGYANFSIKSEKKVLVEMAKSIEHRGPDSYGSYFSGDGICALGIRRLSIIDLKTGDQPIKNEDGSIVVVYNGEIYNYKDLRNKLQKKGHKFKTKSDTEVLVHMYEEYGDNFVNQINGMFAFAIWDENKRKLFMARDRSGVKPLYYYHNKDVFVFGSELKAILKYMKKNPIINRDTVNLYMYLGYIPTDNSIFKNIYKLNPGHTLSYSDSNILINRYFSLVPNQNTNADLEALLKKSVTSQLVSDVPVGVFLSGGIDSSLVSYYVMAQKRKMKSFSISFDQKDYDESKYAEYVAGVLGTEHISETFSHQDIIDNFEKIHTKLDEPFADSSLFPTYKVSSIASQHVKVVLSGDGGDELFGGYPTYQGHILAESLKYLPSWMIKMAISAIDSLPKSLDNYNKSTLLKIVLESAKMSLPQRHFYMMRTFYQGDNVLMGKPDLSWVDDIETDSFQKPYLKAQGIDYYSYLPDDFLFKVDRASMMNSLEVRVPFLDNDLIEYAFSTKHKHATLFQNKLLLRRLVENKLPKISKRPKKGFGMPIGLWLLDEIKDLAYDNLTNKKLYDYVSKNEIEKVWTNHQKRKENNASTIWMLVMLSGWLRAWG